MSDRLLVQGDPYRTRVAMVEDERLVEIHIEDKRHPSTVGSVYKGRVSRVLRGMQAAFVDIGLQRDAFLYAGDVGGRPAADAGESEEGEEERAPERSIQELVRPGQELIVQVVKEPLLGKGARITGEVTLPGRYLVLAPRDEGVGVSRRIEEPEERERLRMLLEELDAGGCGLIARTVARGRGREELEADLEQILGRWSEIQRRAAEGPAPRRLHEDADLALRAVRDRFDDNVSEVLVDGRETWQRLCELMREVAPEGVERIRLWDDEGELFERMGVENELEAALESRVPLPSGGHLVINPTEALVAIDVNTGRYVGGSGLEDTVVRTNLEAVSEIVRQIRLRDLSGILVIDFIDMAEPEHRRQVHEALREELRKDRAKNQVLSLSDFGLVEITRKRSRSNLRRQLTRTCPRCGGSGRVLSAATVCLNLRREVLRRRAELDGERVVVRVHPDVRQALEGDFADVRAELDELLAGRLVLEACDAVSAESFEIAGG